MSEHDERFIYVDVHHHGADKETGSKWRRKKIEDVDKYRQQYKNYNVFATIQRFKNPKLVNNEPVYMDLYFDLDYAEDPSVAQEDARKLRDFFYDELGLSGEDVRFYFSGSKGFHVLVDRRALGVEPRNDLHLVYKYAALHLNDALADEPGMPGLPSLDYASIYSVRRQLRLVDSVHQKTRLFKVELLPEELDLELDEIKALAKGPRGDLYGDSDGPELNQQAAEWLEKMTEEYEDVKKLAQERISEVNFEALKGMQDFPVCYQDITENGIKKSGDRNKATMALASYLKDAGVSQAQAIEELVPWADRIPLSLTSTPHGPVRDASTRSTIKAVYESDAYHFGCQFILALSGEVKNGKKAHVACAGKACPLHQDHRKSGEDPVPVHLADSAAASYVGKWVETTVLVSGKVDTPYAVPKKVRYFCPHEADCQKACVFHDHGGVMTVDFPMEDRTLIEACHKDDTQLKIVLKAVANASCPKFGFEIERFCNVEEVLVVPMADRITTVSVDAEGNVVPDGDPAARGRKDVDETGKEFVSRKVYVVSDPETDNNNPVLTNYHYKLTGMVYPHPKTQQGTILATKVVPVDDSLQRFRLTPEVVDSFKVFQVPGGKELGEHVDFLLDDLTGNVTRVWKREEYLLGLLLTYHSAMSFVFQRELEPRGWLEMLAVGDTGQAKSKMLKSLMNFTGLGTMSHGVSSSRTGLIYSVQQQGERWFVVAGTYVLSDRKMLSIDEFAEMPEDDQQKLRVGRSEGRIKVEHAAKMEFNTRVRLALLSNPAHGKQLREFTHGVESLKELWKAAADIRRLDFCIFLKTSDITESGEDVVNTEYPYPEKQHISGDVLKHSILWAWSRQPEHIQWQKSAERACLDAAQQMSEKYGSADDIPLVSPADQRIKIARMAVALASFVHSTDDNHEKVIVRPEHVEFVREYLYHVYDAKNCRYDVYARYAKEETELTPEERQIIDAKMDQVNLEAQNEASVLVLDLYRRNNMLRSNEIKDLTNLDTGTVNSVMRVLSQHHMIKRTKNGFSKLPKLVEYLEYT